MTLELQTAIPSRIFNLEKTDYETPSIILGQPRGLIDSINRHYPAIFRYYKNLKTLDWDENEFDLASCNVEFKTCPRHIYDMMIKTLAWQWEADSVASGSIVNVLSNVMTDSDAWLAYMRICENEGLHGLAYSEIVRNSFDDPGAIFEEILSVKQAHSRLKVVADVFEKARVTSLKYGLGLVENCQETYNDIFMYLIALLSMERVQFLPSFGVTFAIAEDGYFQPIAKTVQKIAQDEFEVHIQTHMQVLYHELKTERGRIAYKQCRPLIVKLVNEITMSEFTWCEYAYSEGRSLEKANKQAMRDWTAYNATWLARFLVVADEAQFDLIDKNPLYFMTNWMDISKFQTSPQEEENNQYKLNALKRDDGGALFQYAMPNFANRVRVAT